MPQTIQLPCCRITAVIAGNAQVALPSPNLAAASMADVLLSGAGAVSEQLHDVLASPLAMGQAQHTVSAEQGIASASLQAHAPGSMSFAAHKYRTFR